jgi:hypothetical protein
MALRIEKRTGAFLIGLALAVPGALGQETLQYEVWHGHPRVYSLPPHIRKVGEKGALTISETGVSFAGAHKDGKKSKHTWQWSFADIQQLTVFPKQLKVLTYKDNKWKAGVDREYTFDLESDATFNNAHDFLKDRFDQRLVIGLDVVPPAVLWEIPAKHLTRFGGDQGALQIGDKEIAYKSTTKGDSRAWRFEDIENISSSGPFQLSITTFERARMQYGSAKGFNFQLKQKLSEARFNELWLRLNRSKGLDVLNSYRQSGGPQ